MFNRTRCWVAATLRWMANRIEGAAIDESDVDQIHRWIQERIA